MFALRPVCKKLYVVPVPASVVEVTVEVTTLVVNAASVARVTINVFSFVELSVQPIVVFDTPTLVNVSVVGAAKVVGVNL